MSMSKRKVVKASKPVQAHEKRAAQGALLPFPVFVLGASAGGVEALRHFWAALRKRP